MAVEKQDAVLGGGGQLGGRRRDEGPEAVSEGGADLAGGERGLWPDAGRDGAGGVGVVAGRGPRFEGYLESADAGGLTPADGDQASAWDRTVRTRGPSVAGRSTTTTR